MFLEILQNSQENQNLFSNKVALEQVFSCELSAISKNTFSKEHLQATASVIISEKKTLKSFIVLFKLCKENHRVQPKMLDVSFSIEFRFETK